MSDDVPDPRSIDYIAEPHRPQPSNGDRPAERITLPQEVLERHGARILDPWNLVLDHGESRPDSTVYRAEVLLVPGQVLSAPDQRIWLDGVLGEIGLKISQESVDLAGSREYPSPDPVWLPAVLQVAPGGQDVAVDAWQALRTIRRALRPVQSEPVDHQAADGTGDPATEEAAIVPSPLLADIALEHLLVGSGVDGVGALRIGGEPATSGHGVVEPAGGTSHIGYGRIPVTLMGSPPHRRTLAELGGPRVTIAILDTGVTRHPWFKHWDDNDAFMVVDKVGQQKIGAIQGMQGGREVAKLVGFEDLGDPANPLVGTLNSHTGHALMQAGLVAQIAPDARVLMYKLMHDDGVVAAASVHAALQHIIDTNVHVDILSLAFGAFVEDERTTKAMDDLFQEVNKLRERGVIVVTVAGNYASSRPFHLAARSEDKVPGKNLAPMLAVEAKNPDGTVAIFSNEHPAVHWRAPGAMVVSTFPPGTGGTQNAAITNKARASLDEDNMAFASWSGTSFAGPIVAATIAALMTETVGRQGLDPMARAHEVVANMINNVRPVAARI
jgi:hypothetical protein